MRPGWVGALVEGSFFVSCPAHETAKKNEKNIFCLSCCASICPHCSPSHRHHHLLQVRRYVYNDVVRLDDLDKLVDCSYVQPYTINSAKVVFLKPRPQSRSFKGSGNVCLTCDRVLQKPFHFCSLSCKLDYVIAHGDLDLSDILLPRPQHQHRHTPHVGDVDAVMSTATRLEGSGGGERGEAAKRRKAAKKGGFLSQILSLGRRRKGAPHRAPLC